MIRERGEAPKEAPPRSGVPPLPPPISPINWWKLDDEERQEVLELLSVWVPELVRRYALTEIVTPHKNITAGVAEVRGPRRCSCASTWVFVVRTAHLMKRRFTCLMFNQISMPLAQVQLFRLLLGRLASD